MHFNIWPTFSNRKGSIMNNRYIWNTILSLQTTLGAGTYTFYIKLVEQNRPLKRKQNKNLIKNS